jgi:hypothetical protein
MARRRSALLLSACFLAVAVSASADPVPVPLLTTDELKCQKATFDAGVTYLRQVFNARQVCFDKVTRRTLPSTVDCRADVEVGTGDQTTDDAITSAEAQLAVTIQNKCVGIVLETLGFPGLCPDPFGPPYDSFDHEECLIEKTNAVLDRLLAIEHPPYPGVVRPEDFNCQDALANDASDMFHKEVDARTSCEYDRFNLTIAQDVNCRKEVDPLEPSTGDNQTDNDVLFAHDDVLRGIPNDCPLADLAALGFPNRCPKSAGVFSVAELTECMYKTHHNELNSYVDTLVPSTKLCGNCLLDADATEQCDDGDNEWVRGEICRVNCTLLGLCGDPDDSGSVTIRDALFVLRSAIGLDPCHKSLCDINGDGFINTTDALLVLRAVVGLPVNFSCVPPTDLVCPVP